VGGEVETRGNAELADVLADALTVASSTDASDQDPTTGRPRGEAEARAHVHGFHTYPARLHPTTARRLVTGLSRAGDAVLDPFCGSGTVAVEARLAGRRAFGSDVNPLAVALARRKVDPASAEHRGQLVASAEQVAEVAQVGDHVRGQQHVHGGGLQRGQRGRRVRHAHLRVRDSGVGEG
jgi:23S rRNA G2445 N2-methylase RlmL